MIRLIYIIRWAVIQLPQSYRSFSVLIFFTLLLLPDLTGCSTAHTQATLTPRAQFDATYSKTTIQPDGQLDERAWRNTQTQGLCKARDQPLKPEYEPGRARLCWDENYLYVSIDFVDTDLTANSDEYEIHHYRHGDVAELFIKPEDSDSYLEIHVTPRGYRTVFFYPSPDHLGRPSAVVQDSQIRVGADVRGTLNYPTDRDEGWTAEFVVPAAELKKRTGSSWEPGGSAWTVLISRYNYGTEITGYQLTSAPALPAENFHDTGHYAILKFQTRVIDRTAPTDR